MSEEQFEKISNVANSFSVQGLDISHYPKDRPICSPELCTLTSQLEKDFWKQLIINFGDFRTIPPEQCEILWMYSDFGYLKFQEESIPLSRNDAASLVEQAKKLNSTDQSDHDIYNFTLRPIKETDINADKNPPATGDKNPYFAPSNDFMR